jgi:ribonuclease HII
MEIDSPHLDEVFRNEGYNLLAGVDEAGRGPLAGPVFAAAVILPADTDLPLPLDSKKFSANRRNELYDRISDQAIAWSIARIDETEIDRINILQASLKAMVVAVKNLSHTPEMILVDGSHTPFVDSHSKAVRKGDTRSLAIGAASIMAKVERDRVMEEHHAFYPQYGFDQHKGYGTKEHRQAIAKHGPCAIHRKTFKGVKEYL